MSKETLGILISAGAHRERAAKLAEAAARAGKQVRIHVLLHDADMARPRTLSRLAGHARIQVCAGDAAGAAPRELPDGVAKVSARALFASLGACSRHVVF